MAQDGTSDVTGMASGMPQPSASPHSDKRRSKPVPASNTSWPTAIALPSSPFAANFSIVSGQPQTMASRRLWIPKLKPGLRFLPVPIVVASCASLSAFDTASAAPALEHLRSDATHREPSHAAHDDHHSSFRSQRLDHRGRCRIRAVTLRDNNRPMQQESLS
jgi:hypothetical protein